MKLKLAEPARRQVERIEAWWAEHRSAAPALFAREFRDTLQCILTSPGIGTGWPTARRPKLRRILMPRTGNHVYFQIDESTRTVHVLAVWGAPRGRSPRL